MNGVDNVIIMGRDCEDCAKCTINDEDKSRVKVYCADRDKWYYYGQCIPCEGGKVKRNTT